MKQLKEKLTKAPVLEYPFFDKPITDGSVNGIGAVLSQEPAAPYSICQQIIVLS